MSAGAVPKAATAAATEKEEPMASSYSPEQKALVEKVLACKDYYAMLSLSKECSDADIKKAYKKLALQLHPDKNQAPKAEDAFKAISQAFACLSNPDKRRTYDQLGFDPDHRQASGSGMRFRRHAYGAQFAFDGEEISPEEIFNMFFGVPPSNMPGRGRANVYRFYQRGFGPRPNPQRQEGNYSFSLLHFLFLLLLFVVLMFPSMQRKDPLYKLEQVGQYQVPMQTQHNFNYFVKEDFDHAYRKKVEEEVDTRWIQYLRESCLAQMHEKKKLVNRARSSTGEKQVRLMEEADRFPLSACEALNGKGLSDYVPNYSR